MKKLILSVAFLTIVANINCSDQAASSTTSSTTSYSAWLNENAKKHNHSPKELESAWSLLATKGVFAEINKSNRIPEQGVSEVSKETGISIEALVDLIQSNYTAAGWQVEPSYYFGTIPSWVI